LGICLIVYKYT